MFGRPIPTTEYSVSVSQPKGVCKHFRPVVRTANIDALGQEAPLDCLRHNPAEAYPSGGVLHFRSVL